MTDMTNVQELMLTQNEHDRTLYELPGVGTLKVGGYFGGAASTTITVDGVTWQCSREGLFANRFTARDKAGQLDGRFTRPWLGAARATLEWAGGTYAMPSAGAGRPHFELKDAGRVIAEFSGSKTGGSTPVRVELHQPVRPDLLMFATYIAREFAARAAKSAAGASGSSDGGWFDGSGSDGGGCGGGGCGGGGDGGGGGGCGGGGCGGGS